jgi:hypothetical protein
MWPGIAIRNPRLVAAAGLYGITVATCAPADPESKGGSEATVRIAKADSVPTDANLRFKCERKTPHLGSTGAGNRSLLGQLCQRAS